jgi:hypothetical protein
MKSVRIAVVAAVLGAVGSAWSATDSVYSGTFQDADGRKGPIQCELTQKEPGKWVAKFDAANTGKGPNRPLSCSVELTGKGEGGQVSLIGEHQLRPGLYVVTATLVEKKSLKASFKKKDGGGEGTFEMTPGKSAELSPAPEKKPTQ